jgi:hypothetical protein
MVVLSSMSCNETHELFVSEGGLISQAEAKCNLLGGDEGGRVIIFWLTCWTKQMTLFTWVQAIQAEPDKK